MPHWRKLHVKTTDSLDVNDMPDDFTRLMWVLLPLKVCKEGRGLDMPEWIKSQLFPLRSDITLEQVESAVSWYHDRGMIRRYVADGRPYFQIRKWHDHQSTSREAESNFPAPKEREDVDIDIDVDKDVVQTGNALPTQELVKSNSGARGRKGEIALPVHLGGDFRKELEEKWIEWQVYQAERGKQLTRSTANRQFQDFYLWGPEETIKAIDTSIKNNWTGIFEPKRLSDNGQPEEPGGFEAIRQVQEENRHGNS